MPGPTKSGSVRSRRACTQAASPTTSTRSTAKPAPVTTSAKRSGGQRLKNRPGRSSSGRGPSSSPIRAVTDTRPPTATARWRWARASGVRPRAALERPPDPAGHPPAVEAPGLGLDLLAVDEAGVEALGVEGDVAGQGLVAGARLRVRPSRLRRPAAAGHRRPVGGYPLELA